MGKPVIKSNTVIKSGDKFIQVVKICNESNRDETIWVTSWPWIRDGNNPKAKSSKTRTGKKIVVLKGKCKTVRFTHTKKPYQYYTDLYRYKKGGNHQGTWFVFNVNIVKIFDLDKFLENILKAFPRWGFRYIIFLPYPMRLEPGGEQRRFVINKVSGLPKGWKVSSLFPQIGVPVTFKPNEKNNHLFLEIMATNADLDTDRVDIIVEAGLVDAPNDSFNTIPIGLTAVRRLVLPTIKKVRYRYDREYPHLVCHVDVDDKQGLLETPEIIYSTDGGKSWLQEDMEFVKAISFTDLGLSKARFNAWIPLPAMNAEVLVGFVVNDQLGNTNATPVTLISDSEIKSKRKQKR